MGNLRTRHGRSQLKTSPGAGRSGKALPDHVTLLCRVATAAGPGLPKIHSLALQASHQERVFGVR